MSIVDGVGLVEWEGGLFTPDSALLPRVRWAFEQIRAEGGTITLNEAGRPFGMYSDRYVTDPSETASGRSTVNFQWGRYERGETPSAANPDNGPYASEHTQGIAIDCNAAQPSLRAKYFRMVGLENTISSESWHWAIRGPSQVDLTGYGWAASNAVPISNRTPEQLEEEELMSAAGDILAAIAGVATAVADVKQWVLNVFAKKQWAIIKDTGTGVIYAVAPGNVVRIPTVDHLVLGRRRGIFPEGELELPSNEADFFIAVYETSEQNENAALRLLTKLSVDQVRKLNADATA